MSTKVAMFIVVYLMQVKHLTDTLGKTFQDFNREEKVSFLFICLLLRLLDKLLVLHGDFKQGGVLSPILFTLYIDKLSIN